jgi:hypothetical protein
MNLRFRIEAARAHRPKEPFLDPDAPELSEITVTVKSNVRMSGSARLTYIVAKAIADAGYNDVVVSGLEDPESMKDKDNISNPTPEVDAVLKRVKIIVVEDEIPSNFRRITRITKK